LVSSCPPVITLDSRDKSLTGVEQQSQAEANVAIIRTLNFVVCTPDYEDVHKVSCGLSDLLVEVFGPERGLGGRATIGVMALAGGVCFETWASVELTEDA
jgi:hypothetical protein